MASRKIKIIAFPKQVVNPYLHLLYEAVEQNEAKVLDGNLLNVCTADYAVVHYHWPEFFLNTHSFRYRWGKFIEFLLIVLAAKLRRKPIVWTMHNVKGHEEHGSILPRLFWPLLFWAIDGLIALSATSYQVMMDHYPILRSKPFLVSWNGHYRTFYPEPPTKSVARQQSGFTDEQFIIGSFGSIRPYKNVPHLIRTFSQLTNKRLKLIIAGDCLDQALRQELNELAANDPRVELQIGHIQNSEVPRLLRALDLVALPFDTILNSGSALLALSLDVPILVPSMGSLIEVREKVGNEWVYTYLDRLTPEILANAIVWAEEPRLERAPLDCYSWEECGRETVEFYRYLAGSNFHTAKE